MSIGPRTRRAIAVCALALLVGGVITSAVRAIRDDRQSVAAAGPAAMVRQFLTDTVVENDGFQGCRYLKAAEQQRVAQRAASPASCGEALDQARLRLGGKTYTTSRQIDTDLDVRAAAIGNAALVTIRHGGRAHSFVLVPATSVERTDYSAPRGRWRIERGVAALVPRIGG